MAQLVRKLGIKREEGWIYFLRGTNVWRIPMRRFGGPAPPSKAELVMDGRFERDNETYFYFISDTGNIMKAARRVEEWGKPEVLKPKKIRKTATTKRRRKVKSLPLPG